MNRKSWEKIFKDPGADYRSKPFWSWNGKMEEKELFRQLDILKKWDSGELLCIRELAWLPSIWATSG